jgi:hypothetical protein
MTIEQALTEIRAGGFTGRAAVGSEGQIVQV